MKGTDLIHLRLDADLDIEHMIFSRAGYFFCLPDDGMYKAAGKERVLPSIRFSISRIKLITAQ
jgi:hypothetical protein